MSLSHHISHHAGVKQSKTIPVSSIVPWAVFGLIISAVLLYFVGAEQGATSLISGHYVHEFVHDGRHLMGFPCH